MKHFAPFLLSLLLAALLCGCELIKDDPIPPRPSEVTASVEEAPAALPVEEFPDLLGQFVDVSRYTASLENADSATYTLQDEILYPLDYTITVEGQTFALPLSYDGLVDAGWNIEVGKAESDISPNYALEATWRKDGNFRMVARAGNLGSVSKPYKELPLYRIRLIFRTLEDDYAALLSSAPAVSFSGLSEEASLAQVIEVLGPPSEITYGLAKNGRLSWLETEFFNGTRSYLRLRFSGDGQHLCELEYSKDIT